MLVVGISDWERYDARKSAILFCSTNTSVLEQPDASTQNMRQNIGTCGAAVWYWCRITSVKGKMPLPGCK